MDRIATPKLPPLTPDDLPRLLEQRKFVTDSLTLTAERPGDQWRLRNRLVWIDEQIAYCKMLEREGKTK